MEANTAALVQALQQLAITGISVYGQVRDNAAGNTPLAIAAVNAAGHIFDAIKRTSDTLAQVQAENWADDDPRWNDVFKQRDEILALAEQALGVGAPTPGA